MKRLKPGGATLRSLAGAIEGSAVLPHVIMHMILQRLKALSIF
jgi:hypothetical protein